VSDPDLPFSSTARATADSAGNVTFSNFEPASPRMGRTFTGAISVTNQDGTPVAPATVLQIKWRAFVSSRPWGTWYNDNPSGAVQVRSAEVLRVIGINLPRNVALQATFTGQDSTTPEVLWPSPPPAPPPAAAQIVASNNVPLPAGTTQIGSDQPVVVGTSLEIFECIPAPYNFAPGGPIRLEILWSLDGSFVDPVEYDIDLALNVNLRGMILPNLAPFVRFQALSPGGTQVSLTVLTGLPPIVRPPITPGGVLLASSAGTLAPGANSFPLPPYTGPVIVSGQMVGGTGTLDWQMNEADWNFGAGGSSITVASGTATVSVSGVGVTIIPPQLVYLSAKINTLTLNNRSGGAAGYNVGVIALGP
jgi:hypothetical protein